MKQPTPFGKYLLLERINVGGMAEIFLARSRGVGGFQRILAIKKILPTMAEDEEFIAMFIDEARIAAELSHAGIVQIYELGKFEDDYYIAMEFIHGKDLRFIQERLAREGRTMDVHLAAAIGFKICEALDYAHNKRDPTGKPLGIIHRDISPQNVIVSYDGEVKICDFGIAKAANRSQKTQAGVLKGKFGYMSPEQVRGLPLDGRSDIFTVGTLLYEMITMQRLFLGESDFSTLEKVRNADVVPPSTYNRDIPEDLEDIILRSLSKEVEDRQQGAAEVADALQLFLMENKLAGSRELSEFMKESFATEFEAELRRLEEYQDMPEPTGAERIALAASAPEEEDQNADPDAKTMIFASSEPPPGQSLPPPIPGKKKDDGAAGAPAPGLGGGAAAASLADAKTAIFSEPAKDELADAKTMIFADPEAQPDGGEGPVLVSAPPPPLPAPDTNPAITVSRPKSAAERLFYPMAFLTVLLIGYAIFATLRLQSAGVLAPDAPPALELVTVPSADLEVIVDGQQLASQTPFETGDLAPGEHRLRINRRGYQSIERTFVLVAGERLVMQVVMAPRTRIGPRLAGDRPKGDGSDGQGPEAEGDAGAGAAPDGGLAAARVDGGAGPDREPPISNPAPDGGRDAGKPPERPPVVKPKLAELIVESVPPGATLLLNGSKVGKTPYRAELKPDAGTRILLRLRGHQSASKTVALKAGEKTEVKLRLAKRTVSRPKPVPQPAPKKYGYLMANTRPWSKVLVDGRSTGRETPIAPDKKLKLTVGPHTITFEIPGGKRFDFKVEIKEDETLKLIKRLE